jgi:hypothetical protein
LRAIIDFERREVRGAAFIVLLIAAVLSPNISTPGALPAVRLEQLLLLAMLPSVAIYTREHFSTLRLGFVDYAFGALAVAIAVTLVVAPILLSDVRWSLRDPFELARVAEYWFMYRLGLTVVIDRQVGRSVTASLLGLALVLAAFSVVQYLGPGNFNERVTGIWTVAHNLDGVERTGRTVGTIGNANYYGAFSGFLLLFALSTILLKHPMTPAWRTAAYCAVLAATLSVVMAQSRTATFALVGAMGLGLLFVAWQMRMRAAYGLAIGAFLVSALLSIGFVQTVQPEVGSWGARFQPEGLSTDSSLGIRVSRWRSVFAGFFATRPSFCEGERLETLPPATGHEPATTTGAPVADEAARERDATRRAHIATITRGVLDYYCDNSKWPIDLPLERALVPRFLDALPADPATAEPYPSYVVGGGFLVGAELEDPSSPDGPFYSLGTIPNFALNPSFESGDGSPVRWETTGDAEVRIAAGQGLFGESAAHASLPPGTSFLHRVVLEFGIDISYVASVWARPAGNEPVEVELYLVASLTTGEVIDPFASQTFMLDRERGWQRLVLPFRTPETGRIGVMRYIIRAGSDETAEVLLDGATVSQGTFPPSFTTVRDTDPSRLTASGLPGFSDSPIVGAGPRKDIELGTVDNEYLLLLDRYGLLGTIAYLALFAGAFRVAYRSWRPEGGIVPVLALCVMVFMVMMAVFNITAGSYYHFQIMAVFWLIIGALARTRSETVAAEVRA